MCSKASLPDIIFIKFMRLTNNILQLWIHGFNKMARTNSKIFIPKTKFMIFFGIGACKIDTGLMKWMQWAGHFNELVYDIKYE